MSSSTNSKPKITQTLGSKAAIIRPVNRRSGKQTFVRIDDAHNVLKPNVRALELEDYVAQIRGIANTSSNAASTRTETEAKPIPRVPEMVPQVTKKPKPTNARVNQNASIITDIAQQQRASSNELTHADHVDVLQTVAKLDAGFQWIAESNRNEAEAAEVVREAQAAVEASRVETTAPQTTTQPLSQDLVNSIATAIASVLTNVPENKLSSKIENGVESIAAPKLATMEEDTLKLSPEIPRPDYTLPVSAVQNLQPQEPSLPKFQATPQPIADERPSTLPLSAAAWDVPAFRWPTVTDQLLSIDKMMSSLADNCESILSPFGKTIAVTAPTRGQGTTTMALTLARVFALQKKRVLLVDGDIMRPTLSSTIGANGVNWFDNHSSQDAVGECIVHGRTSGVCVMPLNAPISNVQPYSAPIFDLMEAQIDKVRSQFDVVIVDAGPVWQIVDEISSNSHLVDAVMLVNQDMHSNGFSEARERLMDRGIFKFIAAQNSFALRAG